MSIGTTKYPRRGFASMTPERRREIASKGGRAAHQKGTAHEWTQDEARTAGQKGGLTRAANDRKRRKTAALDTTQQLAADLTARMA